MCLHVSYRFPVKSVSFGVLTFFYYLVLVGRPSSLESLTGRWHEALADKKSKRARAAKTNSLVATIAWLFVVLRFFVFLYVFLIVVFYTFSRHVYSLPVAIHSR